MLEPFLSLSESKCNDDNPTYLISITEVIKVHNYLYLENAQMYYELSITFLLSRDIKQYSAHTLAKQQ